MERLGAGQVAYRALADWLRERIRSGDLLPGGRLPTELELAADWGVSRQTVRRAYVQLVAENLVYRGRGRGSFVTSWPQNGAYVRSFASVDDLLTLSVDTELEVLTPLERRADVAAAGRLRLPSDDVMVATFRRFHESAVFCLSAVYLPLEIGLAIAPVEFLARAGGRSRNTIIDLVESEASVSIAGAHQSITATPLGYELAPLLDCVPGEPVLRMDRIYFDHTGNNVELSITHYNPRRYSYRLELLRAPG
jgi:DNA-binding GntR family transcriptional regulator